MNVQQALINASKQLQSAGIEDASNEARMLMAHALGIGRERLTLVTHEPVDKNDLTRFEMALIRRLNHEPMSHIIEGREFYGRWFKVNKYVLDPRPATETLVEAALTLPFQTVLDMGTGSGAILISLLAHRPDATGLGIDISKSALEIAAKNAKKHIPSTQAKFQQSDWFETVSDRFDLIVSNPPYIRVNDLSKLQPELSYEPKIALTDGDDGLSGYRIIAENYHKHLAPNGNLLVEIGSDQGRAVCDIFKVAGLSDLTILTDLEGHERVVCAKQ